MYMLVFVMMIIAVTGTYAQMVAMQAKYIYGHQTTVADAMLSWHSIAVDEARYAGIPAPGAGGCSLTNATAGFAPKCAAGANNPTVDGGNPGAIQLCSKAAAATSINCWTPLPAGYNLAPYTFYSVFYQANGGSYVVTYVPPPAAVPGNYILLPGAGGTQVGVTMGDLMSQVRNRNLSPLSYGMVAAGPVLTTGIISNGINGAQNVTQAYSYALPTTAAIQPAVGSFAIITGL